MYLALIGFLMVVTIMALLLTGKMSPIVVLIVVPVVAAVLAGYNFEEIGEFVKAGVSTTSNNAILFIFSVIFFGVMSDVGVFDILVNFLVKTAGANVIGITVATAIIAIISHLDGATATTVLITIPAMWPIYKKMNMRPYVLLCIVGAGMGVMNLLPWGGPTARAATVLEMDSTDLWQYLIPIQILGVFTTIGLAVILGMIEKKRGAGLADGEVYDASEVAFENNGDKPKNKLLLFVNIALTIGLVAILVVDIVPSYAVFMLFLSIALIINFPTQKAQDAEFKKHAPSALVISATMLAAGVMIGIMNETGMMDAMASVLIGIIPDFLGKYIHIIFGVFALPLGMMVGTDAYFYGIMPLVMEVGEQYGVESLNTALTMIIGKNVGLILSPLVPATFLAIGLVDVELKDHIKFSFKWLYGISIIMLIGGLVLGIIQI